MNFVNIGLESGELVHAIGKFLVDHATTSVFSNKAQGRGEESTLCGVGRQGGLQLRQGDKI